MFNIPHDSYIKSIIYANPIDSFKWKVGQEIGTLTITEIFIDEARAFHDGVYRVIVMASDEGGEPYQWKDYPYQQTAVEWSVGK